MKENLIGKIGKALLIPSLAFSLSNNDVKAQDKETSFGVNLGIGMDYPILNNLTSDLIRDFDAYEGWEDNFVPKFRGPEDLEYNENYFISQVGLKIEPTLSTPKVEIGIPIYVSSNLVKSDIKLIDMHWCDPDMEVSKLSYRNIFPQTGISVNSKLNERVSIEASHTFSRYKLERTDYEGVDCPGCPNWTKVINQEELGRGNLNRTSLGTKIKLGKEESLKSSNFSGDIGIGLYYSKLQEGLSSYGIYYSMGLSWKDFKKK